MDSLERFKVMLAIGGLDPSGGAGVLVDTAAARAAGVHGAAIMAVSTVQDGDSFVSACPNNARTVRRAVEQMLSSLDVGAIKTGALGDSAVVETVAECVREAAVPLVVDPVVRSTTGGILLDDSGVSALRDSLLPCSTLVTPNLAEAEVLTGRSVRDIDGMREAARRIVGLGAGAALVKGGHLDGDDLVDVFVGSNGRERIFSGARHPIANVRGTGCALASLIAGLVAGGRALEDSIARAREMLSEAIRAARRIGAGPPVLNL